MTANARRIGLFPATMLVAGNMIGAGIFMMPTIMASIGSIAVLGWLVTVPGAFIMGYLFARLGKAQPKAGGPYAYARESSGRFCRLSVQSAVLVFQRHRQHRDRDLDHRLSDRLHSGAAKSLSGAAAARC